MLVWTERSKMWNGYQMVNSFFCLWWFSFSCEDHDHSHWNHEINFPDIMAASISLGAPSDLPFKGDSLWITNGTLRLKLRIYSFQLHPSPTKTHVGFLQPNRSQGRWMSPARPWTMRRKPYASIRNMRLGRFAVELSRKPTAFHSLVGLRYILLQWYML